MFAWKHRARGVVAAAVLFGMAGMAQPAVAASGPSAADLEALQSFQLTDGFLAKWATYQDKAAADPCALSPLFLLKGSKQQSLADIEARLASNPAVSQALKESGLNAHEALFGMMTLLAAAAQNIAKEHPELLKHGSIKSGFTVSPENMAVYEAHKAELLKHQAKLGRAMLEKNGGKLPSCMTGG